MLKRKAEAEAAESGAGLGVSSNAKKAKGGSLGENFPNEPLAKLLDRWDVAGPRGRDFPRFNQAKSILKSRECAILLKLRSTDAVKQGISIFVEAKVRLVTTNQAPALVIILQGGYQIQLRSNHFKRDVSANESRGLIDTKVFARDSKVLKDALEKSYHVNLRDEVIKSINDIFTVDTKNLHLMEFELEGKFWFDRTPELPLKKEDLTETQLRHQNLANSILGQLNRGRNDTICIRAQQHVFPVINAYWSNCLNLAHSSRDWSFYNNYIGNMAENQFDRWHSEKGNPNLPIVRQRWMQVPSASKNSIQYRSYPAKRNFSSTKELETILSVGLIGDAMWDNVNIAMHFGKDVIHTAIVGEKDVVGDRILHILVSRGDEFPMPPTPPGSELKVRFMPGVVEAMTKTSNQEQGEGEAARSK
ncbi:uncharacterized protein EAF02_001635 [Botrytis sinoallii]|uniref:uncharacterized protein n=1 Tax=Botrytis sinoallii TaxID=1463999 RepID=UPI001902045B|nr:uncharacterized protein EAF02_001635 [Botrytis sinoallii]KAF7891310.1 hypothetical protein EAF02_001635 [Botrytis sinoallii]